MTLTELAELVSRRTGFDPEETWTICEDLIAVMVECIKDGNDVKIRRLGTFSWKHFKATQMGHPTKGVIELPDRMLLKFTTSVEIRDAKEDVMEKLGVQYGDENVKEAGQDKNPNVCPLCGKDAGEGKNCPEHGTEGFEKKDDQ